MRRVGGVRLKLTVMRPPALVRTARGNGGSLCLACLAQRSDTVPPAECEEPDVFSEPSLGEELGSPCRSGVPRVGKAALKAVAQPDVGALRQHIQDLKAQLLNANKVIQSLQRRTRSISVTSGYTSGTERPPLCPTVPASPPHSLTDEDEGWQSDSHGTLCPQRDLEHLVHRVTLLEAHLPPAKPRDGFPKDLQSATWPGYGTGTWTGDGWGALGGWCACIHGTCPCHVIQAALGTPSFPTLQEIQLTDPSPGPGALPPAANTA